MNARRFALLLLIITAALTLGCGGPDKADGIAASATVGSDGSVIPAEEREMIRALVPVFAVISDKDITQMRKCFLNMPKVSDSELAAIIAPVKRYTLHGLEDVSYRDGKLRARMIYSAELNRPGPLGRNVAPLKADVVLARKDDRWVVAKWTQLKDEQQKDLDYFQDIFARQKNAEKRYGVKDLAKWRNL